MKKGMLLSLIAVVLLSTFVFADVTPAPVTPAGKPPVKKMKIVKVKKHLKVVKQGANEPMGKAK